MASPLSSSPHQEGRVGALQILFPLRSCSKQLTFPSSASKASLFEKDCPPWHHSSPSFVAQEPPPTSLPPPPRPSPLSPSSSSRSFSSHQVRDRSSRVHKAAALEPPQVQLLPLHDPALRQDRPAGGLHIINKKHFSFFASSYHHENDIYALQIDDNLDSDPEINVFVVHIIDNLDITISLFLLLFISILICLFRIYNLYIF